MERYSRQTRLPWIGEAGQARLLASRVVLCGCGALGSAIAETLCRAGVGSIRIVDRDYVELSNLQRQVLYDEDDVAAHLPKAVAAANKLRRINSTIQIEPVVADINHLNILPLVEGADVILDGTDHFEIRYLINDAAVETGTPWVHGGCVAGGGQVLTIRPGKTACLRCVLGEPAGGEGGTCDTTGVLGPAIQIVAALQCVEALKLLTGHAEETGDRLRIVDAWEGSVRTMRLAGTRERSDCPVCVRGERPWLSGERVSQTTVLCGRQSVQIAPSPGTSFSLPAVVERWRGLGTVTSNPFLARFRPDAQPLELTLFADGRALVKGTEDLTTARLFYTRYVGH